MSEVLFYLFAALALGAAIFMIASRNAVNSAMGMIVSLVAVAADYFLLDAPFLGVIQILVQAGAVMVLFLFIIMLLDVDKIARAPTKPRRVVAGVLTFAILAGAITCFTTRSGLKECDPPAKITVSATTAMKAVAVDGPEGPALPTPSGSLPRAESAKDFGAGLFSKYMLPVQIAGFLLLSAMIGVVSLSKRARTKA